MSRDAEPERALAREYASLASSYDARWHGYVASSTRETLRRLGTVNDERVLDVACGTGVLLAELGARAPLARLVGLDASAEMLAVARARLGARARLLVGRAEHLPFADATFDLVLTTSAFHFLREPRRALLEMRRVLRRNGRIVVTDWCDDFLACRICDRLLRLTRRGHQRIYGSDRCRSMLAHSGFDSVRVERYKMDWLWGLMTATARRAPSPPEAPSEGGPN